MGTDGVKCAETGGDGYGPRNPCKTLAGTHCAYPRRDGQAELNWVAGNMPRWSLIPASTGLEVE